MKVFGWIILSFAAIRGTAAAQGMKADYDRADNLARAVQGKVAHGRIEPIWLDRGNRFWYRSDLGGGRREFILVDPAASTRQPAFIHALVASSLSKALGRAISPDRLPFDSIQFSGDGSTFRFAADGKTWTIDGRTSEIRPSTESALSRAGLQPLPSIRPSSGSGGDTEITFVNKTAYVLSLFWIDTDGKRVPYGIVAAGTSRTQHTFQNHVWILARQDGAPAAAFAAGLTPAEAIVDAATPAPTPRQPRPSPRRVLDDSVSLDGKWRAVVRDYNIVIVDTKSGEEKPLTKDGTEQDRYQLPAYWSPDSSRIVAVKTVPAQEHKVNTVESSPPDQIQPKLHTIDYLKPGDRIAHPRPHLFEIASGREIPINDELFPTPWDLSELRWEADSSRFVFLYNQRGHQTLRLIAVDAKSGEARSLIEERSRTFIDYSGKQFLHPIRQSREAVWASERDGWNHLYLYDLNTGQVKNQITKGEWVVRKVDKVDTERRQVWFQAGGIRPGQDPYYLHACRVNFDGSDLTVLTEGDGTHDVKLSPDGKYLVDTWSRVDLPPMSEVRSTETGKRMMELERGDASALTASGWRMPERFTAKGRDGATDIYGVIFRPSNFNPSKKYPVIENIYAGPQGSFVPKAWSANHGSQTMAELGFIVVQIDGMGTNNRSKAFHDVCWKNLADSGLPDRILWMKAAAAKYAEMDLTRVGIYGTSAGGQSALGGILQYPDFYKVSVADCGCHDNRMDKIWWNEQWMGWPVGPEYALNSNVTMAPKLRGKLLLMVGELDTNVDPASTMQVANALVKANKDFDLFIMPGAGHGVAGSPYGRRKLRDFFVRHLLHVEPPDRNSPE